MSGRRFSLKGVHAAAAAVLLHSATPEGITASATGRASLPFDGFPPAKLNERIL